MTETEYSNFKLQCITEVLMRQLPIWIWTIIN